MNRNYSRFIKGILMTGDLLMINIAFGLAFLIKFRSFNNVLNDEYFILFLVFNIAWISASYVLRTYDKDRLFLLDKMTIKLVRLLIIHTLLITAFWVVRKAFYYSREQLMWTLIILYPLVFTWRIIISMAIKRYRKKGFNYKKVVLVGAGKLSKEFANILKKNKDYGYKLIGVFSPEKSNDSFVTHSLEQLESFCVSNKVDEIYCSTSDLEPQQIKRLTQFSDNNIIRFKIIPDVRGFTNKRLNIDFYEHLPVLSFRNLPLDDTFNRLIKRVFDLIFSLLVILLVLSWLYPILALLIKLSSSGPVLFKQKRTGEDNKEFNCLKFRSMKENVDCDDKQATRNDSRTTKIGRFIRKTSLDEFPQFFNVLVGDMSIVGPRPHMLKHTEEYGRKINKYMARHFVKPGITGLAQIKGYRGETTDPKMMENRIRMDMIYIESWTAALDFWIIMRTFFTLLIKDKNVY